MIGHKICFYGVIWIIIPKLSQLPLLLWSTDYVVNLLARFQFTFYVCLNIETPIGNFFPICPKCQVPNGKLIILAVTIFKHITIFSLTSLPVCLFTFNSFSYIFRILQVLHLKLLVLFVRHHLIYALDIVPEYLALANRVVAVTVASC